MTSNSLMAEICQMGLVLAEQPRKIRLRAKTQSLTMRDASYNRATRVNTCVYLALVGASFKDHELWVDDVLLAEDEAIRGAVENGYPLSWHKAIRRALEWEERQDKASISPFVRTHLNKIREAAAKLEEG